MFFIISSGSHIIIQNSMLFTVFFSIFHRQCTLLKKTSLVIWRRYTSFLGINPVEGLRAVLNILHLSLMPQSISSKDAFSV